jgi:hypothetical protein
MHVYVFPSVALRAKAINGLYRATDNALSGVSLNHESNAFLKVSVGLAQLT